MPPLAVRDGVPLLAGQELVVAGLNIKLYVPESLDDTKKIVFGLIAHPRGQNYRYSETLASEFIHKVPNLVCVGFDLPNHGARIVSPLANEVWKKGNKTHGEDMLSIVDMGAAEIEVLGNYVPLYHPQLELARDENRLVPVVIGASLGGHISWKVAVGPEGPFGTGYFKGFGPIVGCPDLGKLLNDRYKDQVGDEPRDLGSVKKPVDFGAQSPYSLREKLRDTDLRILALCGRDDTLVPAHYTETWGKSITKNSQIVDVQENIGHWCSPEMIDKLIIWLKEFQK